MMQNNFNKMSKRSPHLLVQWNLNYSLFNPASRLYLLNCLTSPKTLNQNYNAAQHLQQWMMSQLSPCLWVINILRESCFSYIICSEISAHTTDTRPLSCKKWQTHFLLFSQTTNQDQQNGWSGSWFVITLQLNNTRIIMGHRGSLLGAHGLEPSDFFFF